MELEGWVGIVLEKPTWVIARAMEQHQNDTSPSQRETVALVMTRMNQSYNS